MAGKDEFCISLEAGRCAESLEPVEPGLTMKLIFSSILGHISLPTPSHSTATLIHYATMWGANTVRQANVRVEFHFSVKIWYWEHLCQNPAVVFMYGIYQIWLGGCPDWTSRSTIGIHQSSPPRTDNTGTGHYWALLSRELEILYFLPLASIVSQIWELGKTGPRPQYFSCN